MKAIIHTTIYDYDHFLENAYLIYDKKIVALGPMDTFEEAAKAWLINENEILDGNGCLLMPSLVNAHSHSYSTFSRGMSVAFEPTDFESLLKQLWWRLDGALDDEAVYYSGIVHAIDSVKNGITTLFDHHASGSDIKGTLETLKRAVCEEVGLRGVFCFETSDRFDVLACIAENEVFFQTHEQNHSHQVKGMIGLHASMTLSEKSLEAIAHHTKGPIHVHVAESQQDQELAQKQHHLSVVKRLDQAGLLREGSLLAHCNHIDETEARIIAERGCVVVLNVTSNMNNGVGLPDYDLLKRHNIPVVIGNDSIASSITTEWLNLLYGIHHKKRDPKGLMLGDLLTMIHRSYQLASERLSCKLGALLPDYEADFMLIPYTNPTPMDEQNAFGHVFYGLANSFKPSHVWCQGTIIVENYKVCKALDHRYKEAVNIAKKVWERM